MARAALGAPDNQPTKRDSAEMVTPSGVAPKHRKGVHRSGHPPGAEMNNQGTGTVRRRERSELKRVSSFVKVRCGARWSRRIMRRASGDQTKAKRRVRQDRRRR